MLRQAKTRRNRQTFHYSKCRQRAAADSLRAHETKAAAAVKTRPVLTHTHAAKKPQFLSFSEITYVAENHKTKSSATAALLPNATWNAAGGVERDSNNVMWIEMFFLLFSLSRFHPEGRV